TAIEDRRFYSHYGLDPVGLLRAAITNVMHRGFSQGGSTITQQLAKNLFLTQERTLRRKAQELVLALWLERKFSKAEILELYLNRIYFGAGAWGVEGAAQRYFGKSARQVTLAEAALLAGPGRRRPRHGRRPQLQRQPVQPRGVGQAPARLGVQAVRLSHGAGARADAGHDPRGQADRRERMAAGKLQPRIFRAGVAHPG